MTTRPRVGTPTGIPRRAFLAAGALLGATALAGCLSRSPPAGPDPEPIDLDLREGFGAGLGAWTTGTDLPADPNRPGSDVAWAVDPAEVPGGGTGLRYYLDGRQDDGTVWVVRPVPVEPGHAYDVRVEARAHSQSDSASFNTLAYLMAYAGTTPPEGEGSFPRPNTNSTGEDWPTGGLREPLDRVAGWETYAFEWTSPVVAGDRLYVAVGISAVWETEMTYFLDEVRIRVVEAAA